MQNFENKISMYLYHTSKYIVKTGRFVHIKLGSSRELPFIYIAQALLESQLKPLELID